MGWMVSRGSGAAAFLARFGFAGAGAGAATLIADTLIAATGVATLSAATLSAASLGATATPFFAFGAPFPAPAAFLPPFTGCTSGSTSATPSFAFAAAAFARAMVSELTIAPLAIFRRNQAPS